MDCKVNQRLSWTLQARPLPRPQLKEIVGETFRSNPGYTLLLSDRVPADKRRGLELSLNEPHVYGVLLPRRGSGLAPRVLDQDTALLYYTLNDAGPLPTYVRATLARDCNRVVTELVLDGILELASGDKFVSGLAAHRLLFATEPSVAPPGRIAQLSLQALEYGQCLALTDSRRLATRLYLYNHLPLTPRFRRLFPADGRVLEYLGLGAGGGTQALLARSWAHVRTPPQNGWLAWTRHPATPAPRDARRLYKLYVSPGPSQLKEALGDAARELGDSEAMSLKVGADIQGLLRPDKMVAYFWSFEALQEAAARLERRLEGCLVHGVPFTAEAGGNGLLSWGVDPMPGSGSWSLPAESWRLWVTNRLAAALVTASSSRADGVEPWRFALNRLRLEGVNSETWTPAQSIFLPT